MPNFKEDISEKIHLLKTEANLLFRIVNDPDDDEADALLTHLQRLKECERLIAEEEKRLNVIDEDAA